MIRVGIVVATAITLAVPARAAWLTTTGVRSHASGGGVLVRAAIDSNTVFISCEDLVLPRLGIEKVVFAPVEPAVLDDPPAPSVELGGDDTPIGSTGVFDVGGVEIWLESWAFSDAGAPIGFRTWVQPDAHIMAIVSVAGQTWTAKLADESWWHLGTDEVDPNTVSRSQCAADDATAVLHIANAGTVPGAASWRLIPGRDCDRPITLSGPGVDSPVPVCGAGVQPAVFDAGTIDPGDTVRIPLTLSTPADGPPPTDVTLRIEVTLVAGPSTSWSDTAAVTFGVEALRTDTGPAGRAIVVPEAGPGDTPGATPPTIANAAPMEDAPLEPQPAWEGGG